MTPKFSLTSIKPYALLGTLAFIILTVIFIVLIFLRYQPKKIAPVASPSPADTPSPLITLTDKIKQPPDFEIELAKIFPLLPYAGPKYLIEFRLDTGLLNIKIEAVSRNEFIQTRQAAEAFIKLQGVEDICTLNIFWEPPQNLIADKSLEPTDMITANCPVSPTLKP